MSADPENPSITGLPRSTRLLLRLAEKLPAGELAVTVPDGRCFRFAGLQPGRSAELLLKTGRAGRRFLLGGHLGFAEAFLDGDWETPDLSALLELGAQAQEAIGWRAFLGPRVRRLIERIGHLSRANTRRGARRNIEAHYDLGNGFYEHWLDPGMTYSGAIFPDAGTDLEAAQNIKYRRLAALLELRPEHHVLEIGCGWGGFAEHIAREHGCRVTAITISPAQHEYARARIRRAGLDDRVDVRLVDYRDIDGRYDRIASIEMIESVGEAYWPTFFTALVRLLKADGIAALQAITIADPLFARYRRGADFIQRHVFPGGMLPSPAMLKGMADRFGLHCIADAGFGSHYARTLQDWRHRFEQAWPELQTMGFDERFRRRWTYYLSYCEAGFRAARLDLRQIALRRA
ncbi:MAG TPA: cyclopropane-fatty-acyl-phospholipid synthase family protein [Aliidongia sp.]|nr:cyclopropane-fatty-acyl-phospholipid synthase family protein [Aliidongia sp.]